MNLYRPFNIAIERLRLLFQRRVRDGQLAYLGNGAGVVEVPGKPGYVYARFAGGKDANGFARFSAPFIVRSGNAAYANFEGSTVYIAWGYGNEPEIVSAHYRSLDQAGIDTRVLNPLNQQSKWVYPWQLTYGLPSAVANNQTASFLVTIKKFLHYVGNVFGFYETNDSTEMIDLGSHIPAADMHGYAALWLDTYTNTVEVTTSTPQSLFTPLDITDIQELVTNRPPDSTPLKAFYVSNDQATLRQSAQEVDLRQWLNFPEPFGLPNPIVYRERIRAGYQQLYADTLITTGTLIVDGDLIGLATEAGSGGGGSGGAPDDATYIVQVSDPGLPNAQDLDSLTDNALLKVLTGGVLDEAVAGTDYTTPLGAESLNNKLMDNIGLTNGNITDSTVNNSPIGQVNQAEGYFSELRVYVGIRAGIFQPSVLTGNRTYTFPDYNATMATLAGTETLTNKTLTAPTIADFTNANHDHLDADDGGTLTAAAIASGTLDFARLPLRYAVLTDSKTSGTAGGSSTTTTWVLRDLQTEAYDPDGIVTISGNRFTPLAGTYLIFAVAPFIANAAATTIAANRIHNNTAGSEVAKSPSVRMTADTGGMAVVQAVITANGTDAYEIDTYVSSGRATTGLGQALSTGTNEIYTRVVLIKIG